MLSCFQCTGIIKIKVVRTVLWGIRRVLSDSSSEFSSMKWAITAEIENKCRNYLHQAI